VATGAVPFDIGSDTGGSLRIPAHYCGVTALKPTEGRVPRSGHVIPFGGYLDRLTTIGPIARFVADLGFLLPLIAGPDGRDPAIVPVPLQRTDAVELCTFRIAFHIENGVAEPDDATVEAIRAAVSALRGSVQQIDEVLPPRASEASRLFADLYAADGGAWRRRLLVAAGTMREKDARDNAAQALPAARFSALLEAWDAFRSAMLAFLDRYDVILCPVTAGPAPMHGEGSASAFSYTQLFSLTGWPCVVVRCGAKAHLPIGLQIIARPWREDIALRVASQLEMAIGGWRMPDALGPVAD
jgi:amidase